MDSHDLISLCQEEECMSDGWLVYAYRSSETSLFHLNLWISLSVREIGGNDLIILLDREQRWHTFNEMLRGEFASVSSALEDQKCLPREELVDHAF
jgi:hypothetical protein